MNALAVYASMDQKTALIQKILSDMSPSSAIYFECVRGFHLNNIELFASEVSHVIDSPYVRNIRDLFDIFGAIVRESLADGVLDSYILRLIDALSGKASIVLSGSFISVVNYL